MTRKSLGYVELEWTCPNCGGRNAGSETVCVHCGAPQPPDVEFHQPVEEKIVADASVVERASLGPDIHCAFCGTRNRADATNCVRCGAPLKEGVARDKGAVLGATRDEPAPDVKCPYCGTMNPATAHQCRNCGAQLAAPAAEPTSALAASKPSPSPRRFSTVLLVIAAVVLVAGCAGLFMFLGRTDDVVARVDDVSWQREIVILGLASVAREGWRDEIPREADLGRCREELRYTSPDPEPNAREVCGTPYTVDTGSGFGEVAQDCEYQVYDQYCAYTVQELQPVDSAILQGADMSPRWPALSLAAGQQEGNREETYRIVFMADGERYTYTTRDVGEYARFVPGSQWRLSVNQLGNIADIEPAP